MAGENNVNGNKKTNYVPHNMTVNLQGQTTAKVGATFNSRQVMDVINEKGEKVRGYFTKNIKVDMQDLFTDQMRLVEVPDNARELSDSIKAKTSGASSFIHDLEKNLNDKEIEAIINDENAIGKKIDKIKPAFSRAFGFSGEKLNTLANDEAGRKYIHKVIDNAKKASDRTYAYSRHQKMKNNTNVNRRNNAMSAYAELLGLSDLLAQSSSMTVVNGDEVIQGSFMLNAKGMPLGKLAATTEGFKNKKLTLAPSALKQISNLQILDYLCANVDRHRNNMFYDVNTNTPGNVVITGVQGIDNDASFGVIDGNEQDNQKQVYDRMSLLADIKVIDSETAKAVMALKKEDMEAKLRLAGLSQQEVEAAGNRLTLLQEKIRTKKIKQIASDAEWKKYTDNDRYDKELSNVEGESANIFATTHLVVKDYNEGIANKNLEPFKDTLPQQSGRIPTAYVDNTMDKYVLDDYIDYFETLKKNITEDLKLIQQEKGDYEALEKLMDDTVAEMKACLEEPAEKKKEDDRLIPSETEEDKPAKKDDSRGRLTEEQKQRIVDKLKALNKAATDFAALQPATTEKNRIKLIKHAAESIRDFSDHAEKGLTEDVAEFIKSRDEKRRNDDIHTRYLPTTKHTHESLSEQLPGIQGYSSKYFKRMMTSFSANGELGKGRSYKQKMEMCDDLIAAAKGYLKHKIPNGKEDGLTEKEKARVKFARDLQEYGEKNKERLQFREKEKRDYIKVMQLQEKYNEIAEQYYKTVKNDKSAEETKKAAADYVLKNSKQFAEDFRTIMEVSENYPKGNDIQAACCSVLEKGGIHRFMEAYSESSRQVTGKAVTDIYASLGLTEKNYGKLVQEVIGSGKEIYDQYKSKTEELRSKEETKIVTSEANILNK